MHAAAGRIAAPASTVEYESTFCRNCWPMNIAPMSEPKTMSPAHAATQKVGRAATSRSYSGFRARRCRRTNATSVAAAIASRPIASVPLSGTGAKLIPRTSVPTRTIERSPPRLSTGSVPSFTWLGTKRSAMTSAMPASGTVRRKTEPHQKCSRRIPAQSGPSALIAPPIAAQSAIERVRSGPAQSAVMSASVVGYAMPAARPPKMRAKISTSSDGAQAARQSAGMVSTIPRMRSSLRP